jgi:tRNA-modifying protein YgfZ
MERARLNRYGLLSVTGDDARDFLHAQLTNDILNLPSGRAALAGWCSAKGRLLASFLVIPLDRGYLLQLARDLAAPIAKRLAMFVLRSKVRIADESEAWAQYGEWGDELRGDPFEVSREGSRIRVRVAAERALLLTPASDDLPATTPEDLWTVQEIQAGRPLITSATQDLFVPQMVNFDALGAVDFKKGCYPGQEIVARAQYRGQVKRRMVHARAPAGTELQPGQEFEGGVVVDSARGELLAVKPV